MIDHKIHEFFKVKKKDGKREQRFVLLKRKDPE
jgi:hypothetical protein